MTTFYCDSCESTYPDYAVRDVFTPTCPACDGPCREYVRPDVEFALNRVEFTPSLPVEPAEGFLRVRQAG
jgi:NAD-dependent SIR2 family protein deacetylase